MKSFWGTCLGLFLAFNASSARAEAPQDSVAALTGSASTTEDWSLVPEYRIALPTDILREARVRPDGRISVFPVGDVVAAGRTIRELETALVDLLAAEFKQPRVVAELVEVAGNQIHVLGQVRTPGSFPVGPFMTLSTRTSRSRASTSCSCRARPLGTSRSSRARSSAARTSG